MTERLSITLNVVLVAVLALFALELRSMEHRHANTVSAKNDVIADQRDELASLERGLREAEARNADLARSLNDANDRVRELSEKLRRARYSYAALERRLNDAESTRRRIEHHLAVKYAVSDAKARELAGYLYDARERAERRYGVELDPAVLAALTHAESTFDVDAVSSAGAVGLMQVMPRFHVPRYAFLESRADLLQPRLNVRAGVFVFAEALARHGSTRDAIRAYHGGAGGVADPKPSTLAYERRVLESLRSLGAA